MKCHPVEGIYTVTFDDRKNLFTVGKLNFQIVYIVAQMLLLDYNCEPDGVFFIIQST